MKNRYQVIESRRWDHPDGRRASIYGAVPYTGLQGAWAVIVNGWTIHDTLRNTVGMCRPDRKSVV